MGKRVWCPRDLRDAHLVKAARMAAAVTGSQPGRMTLLRLTCRCRQPAAGTREGRREGPPKAPQRARERPEHAEIGRKQGPGVGPPPDLAHARASTRSLVDWADTSADHHALMCVYLVDGLWSRLSSSGRRAAGSLQTIRWRRYASSSNPRCTCSPVPPSRAAVSYSGHSPRVSSCRSRSSASGQRASRCLNCAS